MYFNFDNLLLRFNDQCSIFLFLRKNKFPIRYFPYIYIYNYLKNEIKYFLLYN